jgi:hypothetical protein
MYWSRRGLSITVTGPDGTTAVQLSKPFARVGSREGSEVHLTHEGISGRAAYIHATDRGIWCCSLARSGAEPAKLQRIRPGTGIHLGPYRLSVEYAADIASGDDAPPETKLSTKTDEGLELQFASQSKSTIGHVLNRTFTIVGRGLPSNIKLDDERLSRVHCLLYREGKQLWVIDLLSQNGTRLDGRRTEAMSVLPGERVGIGGYWLTYSARGGKRHKVVRPPPQPIIVEQTIVREHREQIVTRVVAHGSIEPAGPSLDSFFETIGDLSRTAGKPSRLVSPPQHISIPQNPAPRLLLANQPAALTSGESSPPLIADQEPVVTSTVVPAHPVAANESQAKTSSAPSPPTIVEDESPAKSSSTPSLSPQALDEPLDDPELPTAPAPVESIEPAAVTSVTPAPPSAPPSLHEDPAAIAEDVDSPSELDGIEPLAIASPSSFPSFLADNEPSPPAHDVAQEFVEASSKIEPTSGLAAAHDAENTHAPDSASVNPRPVSETDIDEPCPELTADPRSTRKLQETMKVWPNDSARVARPSLKPTSLGEEAIDDPRNKVLERLIDINTRQAGHVRRRALLIGAITVAGILLAAAGWYFFAQALSYNPSP